MTKFALCLKTAQNSKYFHDLRTLWQNFAIYALYSANFRGQKAIIAKTNFPFECLSDAVHAVDATCGCALQI